MKLLSKIERTILHERFRIKNAGRSDSAINVARIRTGRNLVQFY